MVGQWSEDVRSGKGKYTYANGDTYEGDWSGNVRDGQGVYTEVATGSKYIGAWSQGSRCGQGQIVHANHKYSGGFTDDQVSGVSNYQHGTNWVISLLGKANSHLITAVTREVPSLSMNHRLCLHFTHRLIHV